nr:M20/M25/M40 family metallo-hydrolase [Nakamurella flavida]
MGADGPSLLLNGHMDVVPAESPELWTSPPFFPQRRDGRLYGRGAGDMKCGFAMGALAVAALDAVEPGAISGPLSFLAVVEEENTGNGTLAAARAGVLADAVLLLEPTGLGVMLAGIGVLWLEITLTGRAAHAQAAHQAVNAVDLAYQVIDALRGWQQWIGATTDDPVFAGVESPYNLNVGGLDAGDWTSSVPATARLRVRVGFPRAWSPEEAERRAVEVIERTAAAGAFPAPPTVRSSGLRAPGYSLAQGHPLDEAVRAAHEQAHGTRPDTVVMGSTTDARTYLNHFGVPALCYGPDAAGMHGVDESVGLQSIVDGAITLAHFLRTYYRPAGDGAGGS